MRVFIVSGPRLSGKTSFCRALADAAKKRGIACTGCLELSKRGSGGIPWQVTIEHLSSGTALPAAERPCDRPDIPFTFFDENFDAIRKETERLLTESAQNNEDRKQYLCIIDEIGPLEIERKGGHYSLLMNLLSHPPRACSALVLTVRPGLASKLFDLVQEKHHDAFICSLEEMKAQPLISSIMEILCC